MSLSSASSKNPSFPLIVCFFVFLLNAVGSGICWSSTTSVPPEQTMEPGDIPEIEPGASLGQRIGVAILNLVKGFGQNVEAMPVVCFTCGDSDAERKARGLPPLD